MTEKDREMAMDINVNDESEKVELVPIVTKMMKLVDDLVFSGAESPQERAEVLPEKVLEAVIAETDWYHPHWWSEPERELFAVDHYPAIEIAKIVFGKLIFNLRRDFYKWIKEKNRGHFSEIILDDGGRTIDLTLETNFGISGNQEGPTTLQGCAVLNL